MNLHELNQEPEQLVAGRGRVPGIVQVRQPVVAAGVLVLLILLGLFLWLLVNRATSIVAPPAQQTTTSSTVLKPSNPQTLGQAPALPAPTEAPAQQPVSIPTVNPAIFNNPPPAETAPPPPAPPIAQQAPAGGSASGGSSGGGENGSAYVASAAQRAADTARARRSEEERAAVDSDLAVRLPESGSGTGSPAPLPGAGAGIGARTSTIARGTADDYDIAPTSDYVLQRGMIIPATLYTSIDSTLEGTIVAFVNSDVFDARHQAVVVPRGAKLTGTYSARIAQGQSRLFVTWDAIKLPNAHTVPLDQMPGVDLAGSAGFGASVDRHTRQLFGNVLLLSVLSAGAQLGQRQNNSCGNTFGCQPTIGQSIGAAVGANIANAGTQIFARDANIPPTLHVSEGSQVAVMVEADIPLKPWGGGR